MMNDELIVELASFADDPLGFVLYAFPWSEPGTELENRNGPEPWQVEILTQLAEGLLDITESIQLARTSGHGIGKSALVSWIILWAIATFEDTKGVVTANTENQLKTKTWAELAKWFRLFIGRALFKLTATALFSADPAHEKEWRIDMSPWSERNTEAFAGLHNLHKRILVVYDEASAIPDIIWETTEGALTDQNTQIIWAVFGNPTRNTGRFRECFPGGQFAHRWKSRAIDSRTVSFTNKDQIQQWIDDYGEDSDFVRVRVRGVFPRVDALSFISYEVAREASQRPATPQPGEHVVLGVDVGRFGDDPSVIYPRKGRDAVSLPIEVYPSIDTVHLAGKIAQAYDRYKASFIFVDGGGVGGGVVDQLRRLRIPVIEVQFGGKPEGTNEIQTGVVYFNKRSEMWGAVRDWLPYGSIPDKVGGLEMGLVEELTGPTYVITEKDQIKLESKTKMRQRGIKSPNVADALALTFAHSTYIKRSTHEEERKPHIQHDYNPFDLNRIYG